MRPCYLPLAALVPVLIASGWLFAGAGVTSCDEWTFVHDGLRLLRGEVIYRDYFQFTPPATAWLAALGQAMCGPGVLGPRLLQEAGLLATAGLLFALARRLGCGPWLATLPALAPSLVMHRWVPAFNHHWLVLPWLAGALWLALRAVEAPRPGPAWLGAGACAGLAGLFLQSDGLVLATALGLWLALEAWLGDTPRARLRQAWLSLGAGLTAVLGASAAWLAGHGALGAAVHDVWVWPFQQYRTAGGFNDVPFGADLGVHLTPFAPGLAVPFQAWFYGKLYHLGALYALHLAVPLAGALWGLGLLARRARRGAGWQAPERTHALVVLVALGLTAVAHRGRTDAIHVASVAWPGLLLAASAAAWAWRRPVPAALALWRPLPALALAALLGTGGLLWLADVRRTPERWGQGLAPDRLLADAPSLRALQARVRPGDRLAAWPYAGYWGVYVAPVVGRWNLMLAPHHGYHTRAEYDAFWADMQRDRPRFIVWAPQFPPSEAQRAAEWPTPLPGYRRVGEVRHATFNADGRTWLAAEVYEREGPP
ncbi:MAG: glycosyltransferase family 39 protein [Candidatus Sericytochromatia bacterium]|nr:glycosyltransferase family 39 protein [Candidatus Sericytochromatia bacterium]